MARRVGARRRLCRGPLLCLLAIGLGAWAALDALDLYGGRGAPVVRWVLFAAVVLGAVLASIEEESGAAGD